MYSSTIPAVTNALIWASVKSSLSMASCKLDAVSQYVAASAPDTPAPVNTVSQSFELYP